jgi:glycosyltransferase involved in cell wall biosynthesis
MFQPALQAPKNLGANKNDCAMVKILVLADFPPDPTKNSGDRRFVAFLEGLAKVAKVGFALPAPSEDQPASQFLKAAGVTVVPWAPRWLDNALLAERWDVCLIEFWHLAEGCMPRVRHLSPGTAVVVDSVDVHFRREAAGAALGLFDENEVRERAAREVATYSSADQVVVVNESDRQELASAGVTSQVAIVPNIVPLRPRSEGSRKPIALFVGGFNHLPNEDGLLWFCDEIWPEVLKQVPEAELQVVGSQATPGVLALAGKNGVDVVGYVSATEPYLDTAAVSIAPLRYGGGMKGKVCEALASGTPVVTTTVGADGLGLHNRVQAVIGDTPTEFADGVVWAMRDQCAAHSMGVAGRDALAQICSVEAVSAVIESLAASPLWAGSWSPSAVAKWQARASIYRLERAFRRPLGVAKRRVASWLGGRT